MGFVLLRCFLDAINQRLDTGIGFLALVPFVLEASRNGDGLAGKIIAVIRNDVDRHPVRISEREEIHEQLFLAAARVSLITRNIIEEQALRHTIFRVSLRVLHAATRVPAELGFQQAQAELHRTDVFLSCAAFVLPTAKENQSIGLCSVTRSVLPWSSPSRLTNDDWPPAPTAMRPRLAWLAPMLGSMDTATTK